MSETLINSNADPDELNKFSVLAHRWWDPQAEFKTLHQFNPLRVQWIESHIELKNKKILDVGCGAGILAESMAKRGARVKGIDLSQEVLEVARKHANQAALELIYEKSTAEDLALREPAYYDVVSCMEMLEHVPNPSSVVAACATLVKPGGWVFFSTLDRTLKSYLHAILIGEYIMGLLPRGTHDYQRLIRPSELFSYARLAQLCPRAFEWVHYCVLNRSFELSNQKQINYMLACVRQK